MKAIGYARVSTDGQVVEGVSLEAQQARIRAWCEVNGFELVSLHVDAGFSGCRSDNRPGLQEALLVACKNKAALVVYSLSRLARSTKDAIAISERLAKSGADLVSLSERIDTTSAAGKMIFRMLAVLAEFERDQIAERTKGALSHMRTQGKRISGRIPYGYDLSPDGHTLVPSLAEQEGLRFMLAHSAAGNGRRKIAAALTAKNFSTKTGAPWSPQAVGSILRRENISRPIAAHDAA
ncbi:MAG: recombinase family protein [Nitrospirae bacterium]|nr:recombinase family protein [Nitrospirota bacterium]MDE3041575.1 recombinase family protein [Nitrospirota bacterium]MDE3219713.1 recombinase family protein [Nitrospirota bacterium]